MHEQEGGMDVAAAWTRIETWLAAHAPGVLESLRAGASDDELRAAEASLGVTFPEEFRESWRRHDGQRSEDGLIDGYFLLPLESIVRDWGVWKDLLDGGDFGDTRGEPLGPVRPDWWHSRWIPLTANGAGDSHMLDLAPAKGGTVGQVIAHWHDDPVREVVASSVAGWLDGFADDLEAGKYVLHENYFGLVQREGVS